ncbi:MAG: sugar kinase [Solirubrobacteraceae bacterium]
MTDLVTLGETMALISAAHPGPLRHAREMTLGIGGAESNVAIGFTRLGGNAAWIGRVGDDELGRLVLRELRAEAIDISHARTDPSAPTGLMIKERRTRGHTSVHYNRSGSAGSRLRPDDIDPQLVRAARILHVTGITPALGDDARAAVQHAMDLAKSASVTVSFDVNLRTLPWDGADAREVLRQLAASADILFATDAEARLLLNTPVDGGGAAQLAELGPRHAILKRGADGALACLDGEICEQAALPVSVADPVGAGDAFVAGFLSALNDGRPPRHALARAAATAAFVVATPGDWEGMPTASELDNITAVADDVRR